MGAILWLIRHEVRLGLRGLFGGSKKRGLTLGLLVVALCAVIAVSYPLALVLRLVEPPWPPLALALVAAVLGTLFTIMMSSGLVGVVEAVYVRGDFDLLFASPVAPGAVLVVRALSVAAGAGLLWIALATPLAVWMAVLGAPQWLGLPAALAGLALMATAAALSVAQGLFALIGPRRTRVVALVLAALIGASVFLGTQVFNFTNRGQEQAAAAAVADWARLYAPPADSLAWAPVRAMLGEPWGALGWLAAGAGAFALAVTRFAARFAGDAAALASLDRRRARPARPPRPFGRGVTLALLRKEWRLLIRDPMLLSNTLLQVLYLLPLGFILWREVASGGDVGRLGWAIAGVTVVIGAALAGSLTWVTISAEDAPDLLKAAPVKPARLERAKLFAAVAPVLGLLAIPIAVLAAGDPLAGAFTAVGVVAACLSSAHIGVWFPNPGERKDFRRRRSPSLAASLSGAFVTAGWSVATSLAVSGLWPVALPPAFIALGLTAALSTSRRPSLYAPT